MNIPSLPALLPAAAAPALLAKPSPAAARLLHGLTGILVFMPAKAFGAARWVNLAGSWLALGVFFWERSARARRPVQQ